MASHDRTGADGSTGAERCPHDPEVTADVHTLSHEVQPGHGRVQETLSAELRLMTDLALERLGPHSVDPGNAVHGHALVAHPLVAYRVHVRVVDGRSPRILSVLIIAEVNTTSCNM